MVSLTIKRRARIVERIQGVFGKARFYCANRSPRPQPSGTKVPALTLTPGVSDATFAQVGKGMAGVRAMNTRTNAGGLRRIAVLLFAGIAALACASGNAIADYTDGAIAAKRISQEAGIRIWRKAAWNDDDFLSEVQLGDTYGQENGDNRFYDPVESFVVYYRPTHSRRIGENVGDISARRVVSNDVHRALWYQNKLMVLLSAEERTEARNRIVYILSCRGADGFLQLGRLHTTGLNSNFGNDAGGDSAETYGALSDMARSYNSFHDRSEREFAYGQEAQARQMMGVASNAVIVPNDGEALTYFHIADNMGHPLAREYLRGLDRGVRRRRPQGRGLLFPAVRVLSRRQQPERRSVHGRVLSHARQAARADPGRDADPRACGGTGAALPGLDSGRTGRAEIPVLARRHADRTPDGVGKRAVDPDGGAARRRRVAERAGRDVRARHRRAAQLCARGILVPEGRRPTLRRSTLSPRRALQGGPRRHPSGPVEGGRLFHRVRARRFPPDHESTCRSSEHGRFRTAAARTALGDIR